MYGVQHIAGGFRVNVSVLCVWSFTTKLEVSSSMFQRQKALYRTSHSFASPGCWFFCLKYGSRFPFL